MPEQPTDADLVAAFASTREVTCPNCRYALTGITTATCPECGTALRLEIADSSPIRRRFPLLLVIFAWLLLAGAMNGSRTWVAVGTAAGPTVQTWTMTLPNGGTFTRIPGYTNRSAPSGAAGTSLLLNQPGTGGRVQIGSGSMTITAGPAAGWRTVSWRLWARAVGWSVLCLLGATGLCALLWYRRRGCSVCVARRLTLAAGLGLGAYAAYHAWRWATDLSAWI